MLTERIKLNLLFNQFKSEFKFRTNPGLSKPSFEKTCPDVDVLLFVVATRGIFPNDPAQSCKEIKDLGTSNGDGKYWIDPGRTRRSFKAYCDMTTDGGKV